MSEEAVRSHWDRVYEGKEPEQLSWYEPVPETSLELIEEAALEPGAAILDAGGGASDLAARLLEGGYSDLTVADISAAALERAKAALGSAADLVTWVRADVCEHDFGRRFDLWHDRAVFHFMVDPGRRQAYLEALRRALRPGGHLVLAGFGPQGPSRCSGLPVSRYGSRDLQRLLPSFEPVSSRLVAHRTPSGATQQFLYSHLRNGSPAARQA